MNDWLKDLSDFFKQAWVYIPAILSFITAIGLPSLIQIAKIFASAKLYLTQVKTLLNKFNNVVQTVNKLSDDIDRFQNEFVVFLKDEVKFCEEQCAVEINQRKKKALKEHVNYLNSKLVEVESREKISPLEELTEEQICPDKKKIKIKVKEK